MGRKGSNRAKLPLACGDREWSVTTIQGRWLRRTDQGDTVADHNLHGFLDFSSCSYDISC